jgi:hypothetical protein
MRIGWLTLALGVCTVCPGCSLFVTACRDVTYEAKLGIQECREKHRNRRVAEEHCAQSGACADASHDYVAGYKQGFADYLNAGDGEPPALPPRRYWGIRYQSAQGHGLIEQWYAGWRDGAAAAKESGLRQFVVVPTHSSLLPASPPPLPHPPPPAPALLPPPVVGPPLPGEVPELPGPQLLPSAESAGPRGSRTQARHAPTAQPAPRAGAPVHLPLQRPQ